MARLREFDDIREAVETKRIFNDEALELSPQDVEILIAENEYMKQELYARQCNDIQRVYDLYKSFLGNSTSSIARDMQAISNHTSIPVANLFSMMYDCIGRFIALDVLDQQNQNISKLRRLWHVGLLPVVAMYVHVFAWIMRHLQTIDPKNFDNIRKTIIKVYQPTPKP